MISWRHIGPAILLFCSASTALAADVGTAFTYQGVLENPPGNPLNDTCAFEFALCDDATAACSPGTVSSHSSVAVTQGLFTVPDVDFGDDACNGEARWMTISVRCSGDAAFTMLSPRVELKPAPYALALPGLFTLQNGISPNIIGGYHGNLVTEGVVGATIFGGGLIDNPLGMNNRVHDGWGTIGGGTNNQAGSNDGNVEWSQFATVSGGVNNVASAIASTVGGGSFNTASAPDANIDGGTANSASGFTATIGGGGQNIANGEYGVIAGGLGNSASGARSTVGGGSANSAMADWATVAGGGDNFASAAASTVGGGQNNKSQDFYATVAGGVNNTATLTSSTVGGGNGNTAGGIYSTVPGGRDNQAGGGFSFAAGHRARVGASDDGTFVWGDSTDADFTSTGPNQFLIRAAGGVGIGTNAPQAQLDVNGAARATTMEITGGSPLVQPLAGWGDNTNGQINMPAGVFTAVGAGYSHSIAIRSDGTLISWGSNSHGQINVPSGTYTAIAGGGLHSLAIHSGGTLAGWGSNGYGQINVPQGTYTAIAAGHLHSLAIRDDGTLVGWGDNSYGQISVPAGTFIAVAAGEFHSLAIRSDGTLAAWGRSDSGQTNAPTGTFTAVAAGAAHSTGVRSDGTLAGWGANENGLSTVPPGIFIAVAAGSDHSVAIRSDNTLVAWGRNDFGQTDVPTGTFAAVAAGHSHTVAVRTDPSSFPGLRLLADSAFKPGSNTWTIYSDRRLKKDIEPLGGALERLMQLHGRTFRWRDPASQGGDYRTQMGLIADEVQKVFPQWVGRDVKGYQTLTVGGFEALSVEAFRELQEQNKQLKSELSQLRDEVKALKDQQR